METIRASGRMALSAPATASGRSSLSCDRANGGMTTVSAVRSASGPCSTVIEKSELLRTGCPSTVQVRISYRPSAEPKTRFGMPSSKG